MNLATWSAFAVFACQMAAGQQQDHQNMMDQLGIKALRPGPSGNEKAPNHANYDESKANPFPDLPDALTFKSGQRVTSASSGGISGGRRSWKTSSAKCSAASRANAPKVTWTVTSTTNSTEGVFPVIQKQLVGHADNSSCPAINVDIRHDAGDAG